MPEIGDFPFLSSAEFEQACKSLIKRLSTSSLEAALKEEHGTCFLVIKKPIDVELSKTLNISPQKTSDDEDSDLGEEEDDQEALPVQQKQTSLVVIVEYHIILSPSYQVPVLYFQIVTRSSGTPLVLSLEDIYTVLVSIDSRAAIRNVGVMGGISQGDHPVLGLPYYFVHPCNTADAVREWEREDGIGPEEYLRIWIGLVGGVVGLYVPSEMKWGGGTDMGLMRST